MSDIVEILSSRGKFKVLKVLTEHESPIPLRQLAELSDASLTSTKHTVDELKKMAVIKTRMNSNRKLISLENSHPASDLIRKIFQVIQSDEDQKKTEVENKKAVKILQFNSSALEMIRKARR